MRHRTGQTLEMVKRLPPSAAVVIVHCPSLRRYVEDMIRDVRGHEVARAVRVIVIEKPRDAIWKLTGSRSQVFFDHAWRAHVSAETAELAQDLAIGCNAIAICDAKVKEVQALPG